jgi:predicted GIY-YIG superfamily endonuclease
VGHTKNLIKQLFEHNNNRTPSVKKRGPWELVFAEEYSTQSGASGREREIKRMKSHVWIARLVRASR